MVERICVVCKKIFDGYKNAKLCSPTCKRKHRLKYQRNYKFRPEQIEKRKEYNRRPEVKEMKRKSQRKFRKNLVKHQKEHPEQYTKVFGALVYTGDKTEKAKKDLPKLIDKKVKEMLKNGRGE